MTSSVAMPTEPVAPRMQTRCGPGAGVGGAHDGGASASAIGKTGSRRVDAIEDAAVAGQQPAAVLGAGAALDERLEQVADDAHRDQEDDDERQADGRHAAR